MTLRLRTSTLTTSATRSFWTPRPPIVELDTALRKLKVLEQAAQAANRAEFITTQRMKEGLDSQLDLKKAQLSIAKVNVRVAEAQTAADVARQRLARLTGLPAESIDTVSDSIPAPPEIEQDEELPARAAAE